MECEFLVSDLYFNPNVCHTCKSNSKDIKKCSGCNMISYCSKQHQKLHWPSHKPLCVCLQGIKKELGKDYYQFNIKNELDMKYKTQVGCNESERKFLEEQNHELLKEQIAETKQGLSSTQKDIQVGIETLSLKHENKVGDELSNEESSRIGEHVSKNHKNSKDLIRRKWIQCKFKLSNVTENILGRNLRNVEKDIVLNPKCCIVCKQSSEELIVCETCFSVNYCSEHKTDQTHTSYCEQFTLLYKINKYIVDKFLNNSFAYIETISNFLEPYTYDNDLQYYDLSEYTSFYRTLVHLIKFINFSKKSLTVHVVGASEYECSPYSVYLWENIFHRISLIHTVNISFVGFDVTSDQFDMRLCQNCVDNQKRMTVECYRMSYDNFIDSHAKKISPDLVVAFNSGFHEMENQSDSNTWTKTLTYFLNTRELPIAFTGYTKDEILRDTEIIRHMAQSIEHVNIHFMIEGEVNAEASEKPRVDPEDGVYYLNKYISCFYCK